MICCVEQAVQLKHIIKLNRYLITADILSEEKKYRMNRTIENVLLNCPEDFLIVML